MSLGSPVCLPAESDYSFTQIGLYQNMPSRVYYIYEESNGLIWLGTSEGLLRYDGNRLKPYPVNPVNENSSNGTTIQQIAEDDQHRLWVLTSEGLFRYSVQEDRFDPYLWNGRPLQAEAMCKVGDGLIFGGTDTLYRYSYREEEITGYDKLNTRDFRISQMKRWTEGHWSARTGTTACCFTTGRDGKNCHWSTPIRHWIFASAPMEIFG